MSQDKNRKTFFLFIGFLIIYLLPGIYGHTPWKQDENYSFGIIQTMYETGNWLVPTNAGETFMEKPPLYYWVATLTSKLLSGILPLHDSARSASLLFSVINFSFFILLTRRILQAPRFDDYRIWVTFALYISVPGILRHSHDMFTDVALMTGTTVALYGLTGLILQKKITMSALWLCLGSASTFLSKGVFIPGVLWITLCACPLLQAQCRTKTFWMPCLLAAAGTLVLILPWPVMLYLQHPDLFIVWFWENNVGRFLGFSVPVLGAHAKFIRIPEALILFAFPVGILSVFYFLRHPIKRITDVNNVVIVLFPVIGIILLQVSASSRALYLLPFIAPMAILAGKLFIDLSPKVLRYIASFSAAVWSVAIVLTWGIYLFKVSEYKSTWLALLDKWLPQSYQLYLLWLPLIFALAITLLWFCRNTLFPRINPAMQAALNWGLGATITWGVIFSLLVGWIDYSKGYESVFTDLRHKLAGEYRDSDCMASYSLNESEAPMFYYFTGILHQPQENFNKPDHCRWLITLSDNIQPAPNGMSLFWYGNRPGEKHNNIVVYKTDN